MNWTGGRLRRHSKANSNAVAKAQRQHFARARLRPQNGRKQPLQFQPFQTKLDRHSKESGHNQHSHDTDFNELHSYNNDNDNDDVTSHGESRLIPTRVASYQNHKRQRSAGPWDSPQTMIKDAHIKRQEHSRSNRFDHASYGMRQSRKSANAELKTLEDVKFRLLKNSDWMGLSAVRPLKIDFPSAKELQNVGKRRKITNEEKERQRGLHARYEPQPSLNDGLQNIRNRRRSNPAQSRDFSIRIGDDFDHGQTIGFQSQQKQDVTIQKSSSEVVLPDNAAAQVPVEPKSPREGREIFSTLRSPSHSSTECLIPLNEALDAENFDEVRSRSLSLSPAKRKWSSFRRSVRKFARQKTPTQRGEGGKFNLHHQDMSSTYPSSPPFMPCQKLDSSLPSLETHCQSDLARPPGNCFRGLAMSLPSASKAGQSLATSLGKSDEFSRAQKPFSKMQEFNITLAKGTQRRSPRTETRQHFAQVRQSGSGIERSANEGAERLEINDETSSKTLSQCHYAEDSERFPLPHTIPTNENIGRRASPRALPPTAPRIDAQLQPLRQVMPARHARDLPSTSQSWILQSRDGTTPSSTNKPLLHDLNQQIPALDIFSKQAQEWRGTSEREKVESPLEIQRQPSHSSGSRQNDDEKWMRFMFGKDFSTANGRLKAKTAESAKLPPLVLPTLSHKRKTRWSDDESQLEQIRWDSSLQDDSATPKTIRTSANTVLHQPSESLWQKQPEPSETDFLSRLSPMTGYLDERIGGISTYTNPARSKRSRLTVQNQGATQLGADQSRSHLQFLNNDGPVTGGSTWLIEHHPRERSRRSPSAWSTHFPSASSFREHSR